MSGEEHTVEKKSTSGTSDVGDVLFTPPVYQQRYQVVSELIRKHDVKKFLDIGCAEGKLISHVKMCCPNLVEIVGVDIDGQLLAANKFRLQPRVFDFIFKRKYPLKLSFYQGSVTKPDRRLSGYDFIACVELVEHLQINEVSAFSQALLGIFAPKIAIVTTPNADFNEVFPNFKGFRHPDHKFEWTREEFQTWALKSALQFNYDVMFDGIGKGPPGTEQLGCCSQMATFIQKNFEGKVDPEINEIKSMEKYTLIAEVCYPYDNDIRSSEEQLKDEIDFLIRTAYATQCDDDERSLESGSSFFSQGSYRIKINDIFRFSRIQRLCANIDALRELLAKIYGCSDDCTTVIIPYEPELHGPLSKDELHAEDDIYDQYSDEENTIKNLKSVAENMWEEEEAWD